MGRRSPLVTLAATAVGLVGLLIVNSVVNSTDDNTADGSVAGTQTGNSEGTAAATPTPTTTPPATTQPTTPSTTPATKTPARSATPPTQATVVYVGKTTGHEATVAIAVKSGRAVAYVCDGRSLEAWLTGTVRDDQVALRSRSGERLTAAVGAKGATGSLTLHGRALRFTIGVAAPPAGLYRSASRSRTIGWIVLPDGSQVGVDNDGTPAAAPRLDPGTRAANVGGVRVTAKSITGDETF